MLCRVEADMVSLTTGLLVHFSWREVPGLGDQRAALDRLELVAPDAPAEHGAERHRSRVVCHAMRRFSSSSMTVLRVE